MNKYQTFFPRLVALAIDNFIMIPLAIFDDWFRQAELPPLFFYFWIPLSSAVVPVYLIWMNTKFGQTLGKMAMNIKIVDLSENPIKFSHAFLRDLPQVLTNIASMTLGIMFLGRNPEDETVKLTLGTFVMIAGIWGLADILTFAFNSKSRALHDIVAGTVVVKIEEPTVNRTFYADEEED